MIRPRQDWNPAGQTPNPEILLCLTSWAHEGIFLIPEGLSGFSSPALPSVAHTSLSKLHFMPLTLLPGNPMVLASSASCGLHFFTFTALHSGFKGPPYRESDPATHCQFQGGSSHLGEPNQHNPSQSCPGKSNPHSSSQVCHMILHPVEYKLSQLAYKRPGVLTKRWLSM